MQIIFCFKKNWLRKTKSPWKILIGHVSGKNTKSKKNIGSRRSQDPKTGFSEILELVLHFRFHALHRLKKLLGRNVKYFPGDLFCDLETFWAHDHCFVLMEIQSWAAATSCLRPMWTEPTQPTAVQCNAVASSPVAPVALWTPVVMTGVPGSSKVQLRVRSSSWHLLPLL